jgi:hypothetical protein
LERRWWLPKNECFFWAVIAWSSAEQTKVIREHDASGMISPLCLCGGRNLLTFFLLLRKKCFVFVLILKINWGALQLT